MPALLSVLMSLGIKIAILILVLYWQRGENNNDIYFTGFLDQIVHCMHSLPGFFLKSPNSQELDSQ